MIDLDLNFVGNDRDMATDGSHELATQLVQEVSLGALCPFMGEQNCQAMARHRRRAPRLFPPEPVK
jgi:hypothetical protein